MLPANENPTIGVIATAATTLTIEIQSKLTAPNEPIARMAIKNVFDIKKETS